MERNDFQKWNLSLYKTERFCRAYDNGQSSDIFWPTLALTKKSNLTRQIYYTLSYTLLLLHYCYYRKVNVQTISTALQKTLEVQNNWNPPDESVSSLVLAQLKV